jgi:hypothetical protein
LKTGEEKLFAVLSLFTSASTLVCCAMPALFVTLGAGATLAGLVTSFPQLVWFTEHKGWIFWLAGTMLAVGGALQWKNRNAPCPLDAAQAKACLQLRRNGRVIYFISLALYLTGFFFAFIAQHLE